MANTNQSSVRAISRGLSVLKVLNRGQPLRMMDISRDVGISYATTCRIVQTLMDEGMVAREPARKRYRPTALVRSLSSGYQEENALVDVARSHIVALCKRVKWPISLTSRVGNLMMVRDSTHNLTSLTFAHYSPGYTLPIAECSTGKAYLAFCGEDERATIRAEMAKCRTANDRVASLLLRDDAMLRVIQGKGYATQARNAYTADPGKTSSIAVPIIASNRVVGAIAIIFFVKAMTMAEAEATFPDQLKATADAIRCDMEAFNSGQGSGACN